MNTTMKITGGVFAGLLAIGTIGSLAGAKDAPTAAAQAPDPTPEATPEPTPGVVPAEEARLAAYWDDIAQVAWDQQSAADQSAVCLYWQTSPEAALDAIAGGYDGDDEAGMRASAVRLFTRVC